MLVAPHTSLKCCYNGDILVFWMFQIIERHVQVNSSYVHLNTSLCNSLPVFASLCQSLQVFAILCKSMRVFVSLCKSMQVFASFVSRRNQQCQYRLKAFPVLTSFSWLSGVLVISFNENRSDFSSFFPCNSLCNSEETFLPSYNNF